MNIKTLEVIARKKGLKQADIAALAGISRQAVSLWFKRGKLNNNINIQSNHLKKLAEGLGVTQDELCTSLPVLESEYSLKKFETDLLWDKLYPDLIDFTLALIRFEKPAIARLVQIYGMFAGEKIIGDKGKKIWD